MSSINNIGTTPIQKVINPTPASKTAAPAGPASPQRAVDRLELSGMSPMLQTLKKDEVRTEKVNEIRAQIADGTYDADGKKLDAAIDRLLDELA
ncbi:MAG TPA: flagellar biosynthesis anti-sigma factor FlgM [Tepidisphaeraceae bacterium]|nr:flagellar biosynthesis anti-sigma factor FlgM [Tepidisphaeraceae bacterium]